MRTLARWVLLKPMVWWVAVVMAMAGAVSSDRALKSLDFTEIIDKLMETSPSLQILQFVSPSGLALSPQAQQT